MSSIGNAWSGDEPSPWYDPFGTRQNSPDGGAGGILGAVGGSFGNPWEQAPSSSDSSSSISLGALGAGATASGDGTGLSPSLVLPQRSDPPSNLAAMPEFYGIASPGQSLSRVLGDQPAPANPANYRALSRLGAASNGPSPPANASRIGNPDAVTQYDLPGVGQTYLDPEFARRLDGFRQQAAEDGVSLGFASGYRSQDQQDGLHNDPTATAPAKFSLHSTGDAVDISKNLWKSLDPGTRQKLVEDAGNSGLDWGGRFKGEGFDPRHFYYDPGGDRVQQIKNFSQDIQAFKNRRPQP